MNISKKPDLSMEELARRALKKDPIAQRRLYDTLSGKMLCVCLRYVGKRELAKDIMHDGFITMFEKLESYSEKGSFEGWARKIFVNTALTHLRKSDVLRFSEPMENLKTNDFFSHSTLDNISAQDVLKCVASMPPGFRTVFNLFAIEGYPHNEIAQILRINESTSRSQYARARTWLQQRLKDSRT